jgi:mono/diheme cytochrome c family protein
MSMKRSYAGWLLPALLAVAMPGPAAADTALAGRAREVLRRHCLPCHGEQARGGLRLPEHVLAAGERPLVVPGQPDASLLIDLVEGGSMPPGDRPKAPAADRKALRAWIEAGATAFPPESGRDYLLAALLADFDRLKGDDRQHARYLSLNHLPDAERPAWQKALRLTLDQLGAGSRPAALTPADATGTLLRIDLRELGWHRRPYGDAEPLNLFDLLLLEYPYAAVPTTGPLHARLKSFLRESGQARPVPYVRADWLTRALSTQPLRKDFLAVLGKPAAEPPDAPPGWERLDRARALRELETAPGNGRAAQALAAVLPLKALLAGGTVARIAWERHYAQAVRSPDLKPIVPIDGLTFPDHVPPGSPKVELQLIGVPAGEKKIRIPDDPPTKMRFVAGKERVVFRVRSSADVVIRSAYMDDSGRVLLMSEQPVRIPADTPTVLRGAKGGVIALSRAADFSGTEQVTAIVLYVHRVTPAAPDYPKHRLLPHDKLAGRLLHSLDEGSETMIKITVPLTWVKP